MSKKPEKLVLNAGMEAVSHYLHACRGSAYLVTSETSRAMAALYTVCTEQKVQWALRYWTLASGWRTIGQKEQRAADSGDTDPVKALQAIQRDLADVAKSDASLPKGKGRNPLATVYVLSDFHFFIHTPEVISLIKGLIPKLVEERSFLLFLSPRVVLPPELEHCISVVDMPLPTASELEVYVKETLASYEGKKEEDILQVPLQRVSHTVAGMTGDEAANAVGIAIVRNSGTVGEKALLDLQKEKAQQVRKSGLLEVVSTSGLNLNQVGGVDLLKKWLVEHTRAFQDIDEASAFGLPAPKGILLVGVPGGGKSLTAKTISAVWGLPLLRFDPGKVFASLVGESEDRMRQVCKLAEAMSPAILWIDEVEKGLSGLQSSGVTDSGVTARVFGTLLTWMQECEAPVFCVATANDIGNLPPALIRRFDDVFSITIPTRNERREIWAIHIMKPRRGHPGRVVKGFDLDVLVSASKGFTGAEIEKAYLTALNVAFSEKREVTTEDIRLACLELTPVSKSMGEQVERIRGWCETNARPASSDVDKAEEEDMGLGFKPVSRPLSSATEAQTPEGGTK